MVQSFWQEIETQDVKNAYLIDSKSVWTFAAPLLGRKVSSVLDIGQQIYNNKDKSPLFAEKILYKFKG